VTLSEPIPAELLARCHRNYVESLWQYIRSIPGAVRREVPGGTMIRCDLPSSIANVLLLFDHVPGPEERIDDARSYYRSKLPWRVLTSGPASEEVKRLVTQRGMRPIPDEPGMLLDPLPAPPSPPSSLTVRPVEDPSTFRDFGEVWCDAFRIPHWVVPVALPRVPPDDVERGAQNRFFVGYADGRPVACSTATVTEGVAGTASVGTVRAVRGKGYGTAVTWRAIESGRALGARSAYLAATSMGYPVYGRMGFRRVADYPGWELAFGFLRMLGVLRTMRRMTREHPPSARK